MLSHRTNRVLAAGANTRKEPKLHGISRDSANVPEVFLRRPLGGSARKISSFGSATWAAKPGVGKT